MSAKVANPRALAKNGTASAPAASLPALARTPQQAIADIRNALSQVEVLIDGARDIGDGGDLGDRLMRIAMDTLMTAVFEELQPTAFTNKTVLTAMDAMFDLEAAITGVEAMHRGDARGCLAAQALQILDALSSHMDRPGFWPDEPEAGETVDAGWDDEEIHEINAMLSEGIAVMRSRSHEANTEVLYGAIYTAQHAQSVLAQGLDSKDARDCESASAPIGCACAVLDAALLDFDDIALHGAWRLLDLAHSRLDAAVSKAL